MIAKTIVFKTRILMMLASDTALTETSGVRFVKAMCEQYFAQIAMEIGGRPSSEFVKFMKLVASQAGVNLNCDGDEPRMHRSQFAFKWRCRIVLAFKKTLVQEMFRVPVPT